MSKFKPWHVCIRLPRHTAVEGLSCDDVEEEVALYVFFFLVFCTCAGIVTVETWPAHCGRGLPCTYAIAWKSKSY